MKLLTSAVVTIFNRCHRSASSWFCVIMVLRHLVLLWHMPHGIVLRATIRSNNNCYLLFKQPSSRHSHTTSCASLSLASFFSQLPHLTKSLHSEHFDAINQLLAKNNISNTSAPHGRCQHPLKGALLLINSPKDSRIF